MKHVNPSVREERDPQTPGDRRRRARRRTVTRVLGGAVLAACVARTVAVAWYLAAVDLRSGRRGLPSASDLVSTHLGHLAGTAPPTLVTAGDARLVVVEPGQTP